MGLLILGGSYLAKAQDAIITITNPLGVNVCDVSETVQIDVLNTSGGNLTGITIGIVLPTGITYEASTVANINGYSVAEQSITNLSSIVLSSNNIPTDSLMSFTINVLADMSAITFQKSGGVFRNNVTLNYSTGSVNQQSNAYNLFYPVLSITSINPSSQSVNSGDVVTRDVTIVNGGNGRVSAFTLDDIYGTGLDLQSVNVGSLNATHDTISLSGTDFSGIGNFDNYFNSGESVTVTETFLASGCNASTITSTIVDKWGCGASTIQSLNSYASISLALKTPSISVSTTNELSSCFANGGGSTQTITLTNNGLGKSVNTTLDIYKSTGGGYNQNIFSRIDENNITYQILGGASGTLTPATTYLTTATGSYSCLGANPVGRVILNIPDLDPSEQITITFVTYHCNISVCNNELVEGWAYSLDYEDFCAVNTYNKTAVGQNENSTNMAIFTETPMDINDGETKEFTYTITSYSNDLPVGTNARLKVDFTLPLGVSYSNLDFYHNGLWSPASLVYNTGTNVVTAYYELPTPSNFNILKSELRLDLTGNCAMSGAVAGPVNVVMNISYISDNTCAIETPFICDETVSVDLHCPSGDVCEGISFNDFTITRTSFGQPDNNQDGLPDASGSLDLAKIKVNRAMYGDTIRGRFVGAVKTSATHPSWSYAYASQVLEKGTYLSAIGASVTVYDSSAATYITANSVPVTTSTSGLNKTYTYDISPASLVASNASFSGFTYVSGDSIWVNADYKVTTNIGDAVMQLGSTNEFYTGTSAFPSSGNRYQCGYFNDNYTLIGYYFYNSSRNRFTINSCSKQVYQDFFLSIGNCCDNYEGGNLFPSEYRNWGHLLTATVNVPANYTVSNVFTKIYRTKATNSSVTENYYNLNAVSQVGQLYTYNMEAVYDGFGGTVNLSDDGFSGRMYMTLEPNCDVPISTYQDVTWRFNFQESNFIGGGTSGFIDASSPDQIRFTPPVISLNSDNPIQDGLTKSVTWDLKLSTSTNVSADNTWIHIKNPSGGLTITSVVDDGTGQPLTKVGDIYQLGTISNSGTIDLSITGTYSNCVQDYITVYAGYECTGYPDLFENFRCGFTSKGLFVEPKAPQMQVTLVGTNVGTVCSDVVEIELDVSSVKFASIDSMVVTITPSTPGIMTFQASSGQFLYPLSGAYGAIADPTVSGNDYIYHIVNLNSTIAANGLPGVLDLANNHFKLKFNMVLDPAFESGNHVDISIDGQSICGQAIASRNVEFDPSVGFSLSSSSGLTSDATNSWSASWGDYNNDGYEDLFVTSITENEPNILYKNNGDKTFSKVLTGAIVTDQAKSVSSTWGDYDNDGYLDLFVANNNGSPNFLYHNNGNSTFTRIMSGDIVDDGVYCHSAAWGDYDNDGYLDLFVSEYFATKTNHLFHNNGDGTFTAVQGSPVVTDAGQSIGAAWGDYNNDGLLDLFVPNTNAEPNWLYKNIGNGMFVKVNENVVSAPSNSVGCSWGDYDNDGYLDLFIANSSNSNNFLYHNNGDGTFTANTSSIVANDGGHSHGSSWIDMDNDGDLDLYVTNDQDNDNFLYRNNGSGVFTKVQNDLTSLGGNSFGTAISDYDNDGDYDLFVANHESTTNFFFENTKGQCASYLCMSLIGSNSNYYAIGTKVRAKATINGASVWQMHEVSAQSGGGAGSQNSMKVIFGLGDATIVDSLLIEWPSGFTQVLTNVSTTTSNCNIYTEPNGAYVTGKAYIDLNLNCQYDIGETLMKNVAISVAPNGKTTYTNETGDYSFYLNLGTYDISATTPAYYSQFCPVSNGARNVVVSQIGTTIPNNDFGFVAVGAQTDLSVCLSTTMLRVGFTNQYAITYQNIGNYAATNDTIKVTFDAGIDIVSSTIPWDLKVGQNLYWYFASIVPQTSVTFYVTDSVTTNTVLGSYVTNTATISSASVDANLANNSCNDVSMIVGAIDPNDKLVYPHDVISPGENLIYKIRFQNVGNYPAESVVVYDTLSKDLDISTINNVLTSHEANFTIEEGNILKWEFNNIHLADSVHNEPESHGYVQFSIRPYHDLPFGRVINNSAAIVFDYYQMMNTNNTRVRVEYDSPQSYRNNRLMVYPQPVVDLMVLQYKSTSAEEITIQFQNVLGQIVWEETKNVEEGWNRFDFNVKELTSMMYVINLISSEGAISKRVLIAK